MLLSNNNCISLVIYVKRSVNSIERDTLLFVVNCSHYLKLEVLYFGSKRLSYTDVFRLGTDQEVQRLVFLRGG